LNRDEKTTIAQIARDFGGHECTIARLLCQAEIDAGNNSGKTTDESAELRELWQSLHVDDEESAEQDG